METDVGMKFGVETDDGATVVEAARELERRLGKTLGGAALTTRVVVNGDGWRFVSRGDEVVFKHGGTLYRIARSVGAVVFADEEVALSRGEGVGHRG